MPFKQTINREDHSVVAKYSLKSYTTSLCESLRACSLTIS